MPQTVLYNTILLMVSSFLGQLFTTTGTDSPNRESILKDWILTIKAAEKGLGQSVNTEALQQIKLQAWKALCARASYQSSLENIERSLRAAITLLEILPTNSPSWIECSLDAGKKLRTFYMSGKTFNGVQGVSLLQNAIHNLQSALAAMPKSDIQYKDHQLILDDLFQKLINESSKLQTHFWETETFSYLEMAVLLAEQARDGLSSSSSSYAKYISNDHVGLLRKFLYIHLGRFEDLQRAICSTESALQHWEIGFTPESDVAKAARPAWRAAYHDQDYPDQFELSLSTLLDIDAPYKDGEVEPGLTMHIGSTHAFLLNLLSEISRIAYHRRCHFDRSRHWIDDAVKFSQRSCNHLGPLDPGRYEGFVELTTALMTRFRSAAAQPSDLDGAIQAATVATGLAYKPIYTNSQNPPRRCQRYICKTLDVAADVLTARFLRDRDARDLDEAVHAAFCVANSTHSLHPLRPFQVYSKYERCRLRLMVADQQIPGYSRLSNMMIRRAHLDLRSIVVRDNVPSVAALVNASTQTKLPVPHGSICRRPAPTIVLGHQPVYLDDLSPVAKRGSFPLDLRFSFDSPQYLLDSRPRHPTGSTNEESTSLITRLHPCNLEQTIYDQTSKAKLEDPFQQLKIVRNAILESIARKDHSLALSLGHLAIQNIRNLELLLPGNGPTTEHTSLVSTLSIEIASEMLTQNCDVWDCIRALEAGKELGSRTEPRMLTSFWYKTVRLIREADEINARLRHTTTEWQDRMSTETSARENFVKSSSAFSEAIKDLHKATNAIPNHSDFKAECLEQAERGSIVFLVPTEAASFAIILSASTQAKILKLPEAPVQQLRTRLNDTFNALKECEETGVKGKANPKLRKLLEWLWQAVVRPVIEHMRLQPYNSSDASKALPLIRWIPFKEYVQAPLHAAGRFKEPKSSFLSHYAVSSYLPSIRYAVITSRRYASDSDMALNTLLTISMPNTVATPEGKLADLDIERENNRIAESLQGRFNVNRLIMPEMGTLESLLTHVRLAHFTCHGLPHGIDPLRARLVIWREEVQSLTVGSIRKMGIPGAKLAFVSACHSAVDQRPLADGAGSNEEKEPALHIVSALQLAGFPTVVGTLWHAYQDSAIDIASHFYRFVADRWAEGKREMNGDLFARALHYALYRYQEDGDKWNAVDWASWVCFSD
ncbi:hypothetical protein MMC24_003890 [Lignoscripta atroalba]|nr:hypothetical protein [Lignoscripta atroalba]